MILDTFTYQGIRLQSFYNAPCEKLLAEIKAENKQIIYCGYKKRKKSMIIGAVIRITDSSELTVYFKSGIYELLEGSACDNKQIKKSKIDYFVIQSSDGSKRIVSKELKKKNE